MIKEVEILPPLTEDNYYQDRYYMSTSRLKEYIKCPLRQEVVDLGFWPEKTETESLLVGNYVHSYFETKEAHEAFLEMNQDKIISQRGKTAGQVKAPFKQADKMIAALEKEELFNRLYHGTDDEMVEKERIITGTLEGIPFKCKIDSLNLSGGYFIDLKTMESLQSEKYSTTLHRYTKSLLYNIVEYQYTLQMYVYQELLKQTYGYEFTPYIMAVSKEPVPDKELILIDDTIIEMGRDIFYGHVEALKDALAHKSVEGCGHCDYCLTNKSLVTAKTVAEFLQQ